VRTVVERGGDMKTVVEMRLWLGLLVVWVLACGSGGPTSARAPKPSKVTTEKGDQTGDGPAIGESTRVASAKLIERRHKNALASDTLDETGHSAAPPKTSAEIYKTVAPATVVVRVGGGFGSGIIVDPKGWILTNHHVIDSGETDDFKHKATVLMGTLNPKTGAMERQSKEYEAYVYKYDKLRDIALLKLSDPPKAPLPFVKVAKQSPVPGSDVVALGHAGAGMLWALKSGQISALGKLSETLAQLASFKDDDDGREMAKRFKEFVDKKNLGLVIQSTCNILPGDSGGPLLNDRGELVGLNVFARIDRSTGGLLSFHVHRDELRKFADARPKTPSQMIPDPWEDGGGDLMYEDADLDGKVDVLMMVGRKPCSFCPPQSKAAFIDADQDSYEGRKKLPDLEEVYDMKDFDAELVYLELDDDAFIWYDRDDDGSYDLLLHDEGARGSGTKAFSLDADGVATENEALSGGKPFQVELFKDAALRERIARVTRAAFPERLTDAPVGSAADSLPNPMPLSGRGILKDLDLSGTNDAVDVTTAFSKRLLVDADESFVPGMENKFAVKDVERSQLDAEVVIVSQGKQMWVFYDQDDDGQSDLVLHAPGARLYAAKEAFALDASGKKTPARQHVGRMLVRPGLLKKGVPRAGLGKMVGKGIISILSAELADGIDSFPHPVEDHRGTGIQIKDLKKHPKVVVSISGYGSDGYLLDLDRSSGLFGPVDKIDIKKRVTDGRFDPEVAYFQRNGLAWMFYDTDDDKTWDVVLVATDLHSGKVAAGYRIEDNTVTYDEALTQGAFVRPSLMKKQGLAAKLRSLGPELFSSSLME